MDLKKINQKIKSFVKARDWEQFHSPKNLSMALSVEASELVEIFQWLKESDLKKVDKEKVADEIADIFFYLVRISQKMNIDIEKSFHKKATVLDFIFTSCAGPCPIMTNNMTHLYEDYENVPEVQFVSVTVDPKIDNASTLKEYAKANGVKDDRWQFLTSDIESIKDLKKNGFMLYAGELPRGHAIKFVLIDQDGQIRKYYDGTDKASMAVLRKDLNNIVNEIQS